ncbi:hypothetical protein GGD66_002397 [Bradyrhizobium sp. CIR48]|nr:hypothetical protein [Bradyrhizobium sp. CIR48]
MASRAQRAGKEAKPSEVGTVCRPFSRQDDSWRMWKLRSPSQPTKANLRHSLHLADALALCRTPHAHAWCWHSVETSLSMRSTGTSPNVVGISLAMAGTSYHRSQPNGSRTTCSPVHAIACRHVPVGKPPRSIAPTPFRLASERTNTLMPLDWSASQFATRLSIRKTSRTCCTAPPWAFISSTATRQAASRN